MELTLILAAAVPSLAIGRNGALPWRLAREMKYFRQVTTGGVVIMGHKTWKSIPAKFRPLADRVNVVLSRHPGSVDAPASVLVAPSLQEALAKLDASRHIFIIGGAELYKTALALPVTKHILLTEISADVPDCDTFFDFDWYAPGLDPQHAPWKRQSHEALVDFVGLPADQVPAEPITESGLNYSFTLWRRQ